MVRNDTIVGVTIFFQFWFQSPLWVGVEGSTCDMGNFHPLVADVAVHPRAFSCSLLDDGVWHSVCQCHIALQRPGLMPWLGQSRLGHLTRGDLVKASVELVGECRQRQKLVHQ